MTSLPIDPEFAYDDIKIVVPDGSEYFVEHEFRRQIIGVRLSTTVYQFGLIINHQSITLTDAQFDALKIWVAAQ
jgi:hypothetical protein